MKKRILEKQRKGHVIGKGKHSANHIPAIHITTRSNKRNRDVERCSYLVRSILALGEEGLLGSNIRVGLACKPYGNRLEIKRMSSEGVYKV